MSNRKGEMAGMRLCKTIVCLILALLLLCGNLSGIAPSMLNALAMEIAETPVPVRQETGEEVAAPQTEATAEPEPQAETPSDIETEAADAAGPSAGIPAENAAAAGENTATDMPAAIPTETNMPATDALATEVPAADIPVADTPAPDKRSTLQRVIEEESGAYVTVQSSNVYGKENLDKLIGVVDSGLAFATNYTKREDGEDSVRVIFRTRDDSLLIGFIPADRAAECDRQQTIDKLMQKDISFLIHKEPDLPLSVIGFTYAQDESEQGESKTVPADEEDAPVVVEEVTPYLAAAIRNGVSLRSEPGTGGLVMAQLEKDVCVTVCGQLVNAAGERWYFVTYQTNSYYVPAEQVEAVDAPIEMPADTEAPAKTKSPDGEIQPDNAVNNGFVFMPYPGELPAAVAANGDDSYTHTATDGTLTLLAYGSVDGGAPAFYRVDENEIVHTDAPFATDAPAAASTEAPGEGADSFVQMDYQGDPVAGITANGDGYYTYTAPDGASILLVYGRANSDESAFYVVDADFVINLTAPFVPAAGSESTAAPETDAPIFTPITPDASLVPQYYLLVSDPAASESGDAESIDPVFPD